MRCHICDKVMTKPVYNKDLKGYEPCDTCLDIINDLLNDFKDQPFAAEDDLRDGTDLSEYRDKDIYFPPDDDFT